MGSVISNSIDLLHEFASVTVTEYNPVDRLEISSEVSPFDQMYVYPSPSVPPFIVISIKPSLPPKHETQYPE